MKTALFTLRGGNYVITWTATPNSKVGCFHGGALRALEGTFSEHFGSTTNSQAPATGETRAYNVPPGQYYVETTSGCDDWTMTITPQ